MRLRRWDPDAHVFVTTAWPQVLERWHPEFAHELEEFNSGRAPDRPFPFRGEDALLVAPLRNVVVNPPPGSRPQEVAPLFGFTILELDMAYIRDEFLPELAQHHFTHADGDIYRVAVFNADTPTDVLFQSDVAAPVTVEHADATAPLMARSDGGFMFGRPADGPRDGRRDGPRDGPRDGRRDSARDGARDGRRDGPRDLSAPPLDGGVVEDDPDLRPRRDDGARWRLAVQHQSGSLEAAVGGVRRRNLVISFGVLLLLTVSVALLAASSQRAQRLAQQQMEFVAGISHELRTPVAVIRSAAENLSQGIVGSGDRVKRYGQMIESEARRLGEMVERVLQYAGIESGLGAGTRAPLAAAAFIQGAIDSSLEIYGAGDVTVQRDIAPDLPPVVGDEAACGQRCRTCSPTRSSTAAPIVGSVSAPSRCTAGAAPRSASPSAIMGRASRRQSCRTSSSRSTAAPMRWRGRSTATGSACHWSSGSLRRTAAASPSARKPTSAARSPSASPLPPSARQQARSPASWAPPPAPDRNLI